MIHQKLSGELEFDTLNLAREAATDDATASGGRVYTCTVFQQGGRRMLSTSFPFPFLAKQVRLDPALKGGNPRVNMNRPLMLDHVKAIRQYLLSNPTDYVLPPVTLNLRLAPQLYVQRSNYPYRIGYLVVGDSTMFDVTDGQHRIAAIAGSAYFKPPIPPIFVENETFEMDSIAALVVIEDDLARIHQDFADAAQTKQIPASLLAAFNVREPVNRILVQVVERSRLLKSRVDETSNTLAKYSQSVFTLNQVRVFVKNFLLGKGGQSEKTVLAYSQKELSDRDRQSETVERILRLLDILTTNMKPWKEIANFKPGEAKSSDIPDLREEYVNLSGSGLGIIGRVAHEISKLDEAEWDALFTRLANDIDWRRDAGIWLESGFVEVSEEKGSKRITGGRDIIETTVNRILKELGLKESATPPETNT